MLGRSRSDESRQLDGRWTFVRFVAANQKAIRGIFALQADYTTAARLCVA